MKIVKSYIFQSFAIIVMASGFFLFFKGNLPDKIFPENKAMTENVVIDSLLLEAFEMEKQEVAAGKVEVKDTKPAVVNSSGVTIVDENVIVVPEDKVLSTEAADAFEGMVYLESFFARLYEYEQQHNGRVRIAYYGDSMTDGDMIVQDLRKNYQTKYGGSGVGYVPINSESSQSRGSVVHRYSKNWKNQSYVNVKRPSKPFGVSGQVAFVKDTVSNTWVSYQAGQVKGMTTLHTPTLYYGRSSNGKARVSILTDKDTLSKHLDASAELNKLKLTDKNVRSVKITFKQADSIPFYGVDFSSAEGLQVDNFSSRGNSGMPLSLFKISLMQKYQKNLDYSLIVLHFGTNVLNYGSLNYSWYTSKMGAVVSHLKQCFPNASILIISTADKASKVEMKMQTDAAVVPLMKAQRLYAQESHAGFFDLYSAMGGKGSMVKWVEESPVKANKDYTHFNFKGASEVSNLIFKRLESAYGDYKAKRGQ
ncbi:MAG: hypothetical protein LBE34_00540 [Flavobacteriaceae bacterium]|nr:hypothetical protein [Flavobacteriaceae bacterium]